LRYFNTSPHLAQVTPFCPLCCSATIVFAHANSDVPEYVTSALLEPCIAAGSQPEGCNTHTEEAMLPPTIRVVYADNHPVIRDGIERALEAASRIRIVGVATNFSDVFGLLPTTQPDVVILDIIDMCGSPLATIKRINQEYPGTGVIMFSSSISMAPEMLAAGAKGYVAKDEVTDQLIEAVYAVYAGSSFVSPLVQEFVDNYGVQIKHFHLTARERDVLNLIVQGHKTIPIADTLGIDPRSVDNYVLRIRKKTGCETRTDMANWYRRVIGEPDHPSAM